MKKNLFALLIALLSVGQVFAGSTYYQATMNVKTSSKDGVGNGTVYIKTKGETSATAGKSTSSEQDVSFELYAEPNDGSTFLGWNDGDGVILGSNSSPWTAIVKTATGSDTKSTSGSDTYYTKTYSYTAVFKKTEKVTVTFKTPQNGSYTLNGENVISDQQMSNMGTVSATLVATPQQNYKFLRWWKSTDNGVTKVNLGFDAQLTNISFTENCMVGIEFIPATTPVFIVKGGDGTMYTDLNAACEAAKNVSSKTVVLFSDGTLPAGNYTIPQGVTLLIPFEATNQINLTEPEIWNGKNVKDQDFNFDTSNDLSNVYRKLTLLNGAKITVYGNICVNARRWTVIDSGGPNVSGTNRIYKGYGLIEMNEGSSVVVENGGKLYCWGHIRGAGTVEANSGAEVRECFVFTDWRNGDYLANYAQKTRCFPMNQYFIQDIQAPLIIHSGASEILVGAIFYSTNTPVQSGTMNFVGNKNSQSFIELSDEAFITKYYDENTDRLVINMEEGANFNNFKLNISKLGAAATTETHIFTLTNNLSININSGITHVAYDLALAAGAQINIAENAELVINSGASMYVYDRDEWGNFASNRVILPLFCKIRTAENLTDAEILVNGKITVEGGENQIYKKHSGGWNGATYDAVSPRDVSGIYTTLGGAKIYSTAKGQIVYEQGAGTQEVTFQLNGKGDYNDATAPMAQIDITPAQLKNADDSYTATAGASGISTFKYFSEDGKWKKVSKVTFKDGDTIIKEDSVAQGDTIIPPTEELPTKVGYEITRWSNISDPMGTTDIISEARWEQIKIEATTIEVTPQKVIKDTTETSITENNTYTINEQVTADTVKVDEGATIEITEEASVKTQTLALSTSPSAIDTEQGKAGTSSQIKGKGTITAQNVFIDITMDPSGTLDASKYYAFAVPFAVNVNDGVQQFKNDAWEACTHNTHYRAYTYDGANRATNGKGSNWTLVDNNGTFQPGVFYLVEFAPGMGNVYRFTKATESDLNNAANIVLEEFAGTNDADKGWNGIANNALQNASISVSNTDVAQVFDPAQNAFVTVGLEGTQFAIGTPLFVQVENDATATNSAVAQPASIPARMLAQTQTETLGNYIVRIAAENADKMADQLFISASEDAENNYVIGKDLVKMFMGNATTAQLWVNNYDKKLSMHQALLANGSAEASLTLFAPKAGNYRIYLKETPEDATIYLLENGYVVANLNDDAYYVALTKGENSQYGLRINAKTKADVTTSINDIKTTNSVQKVLFQNKVYIVRNRKLFNTLGQPVK